MKYTFTTPSEANEQPQVGKCLLCLFLVFILFCVVGCSETGGEEKLPAYANKSEETVRISYIRSGPRYEKSIADGDTLHSSFYYRENRKEWNIPNEADCGIAADDDCNEPVRMELFFLEDPQKCLIFEGPIEHDGIDMRSWDSYEIGNEIDEWADFWVGVEYVYTITPEHREMAGTKGCRRSSTSE
ncbi:MAG: hypothetical protein LBH25_10360 [Fibromonadaceae bacterium]|nr:hypothetical protein [Fibromonadaceae bacterium]